MPGDEYRRDRFIRCIATEKGERPSFYFERYHLPQCYGPTEEEDRRMREEIERQREAERGAERRAAWVPWETGDSFYFIIIYRFASTACL